jgi:molybdenum cofactor cytidylyltransferase
MGRSKQLLDIDGEKLLVRTIRAFLDAAITPVVVVLGSDEKTHRELIQNLPADIVYNPEWERGMGSSIRKGLDYLLAKDSSVEGIIISVCDQPLLSKESIANLIEKYEDTKRPVIASGYSGGCGVPVLFHRSYFSQLANLPNDQGAKKILMQNPFDVSVVSFEGGAVDLDTPGDYQAFVSRRPQG